MRTEGSRPAHDRFRTDVFGRQLEVARTDRAVRYSTFAERQYAAPAIVFGTSHWYSLSFTVLPEYFDRSRFMVVQLGTAKAAFGGTSLALIVSSAPIISVFKLSSSTKTCSRHGRWFSEPISR